MFRPPQHCFDFIISYLVFDQEGSHKYLTTGLKARGVPGGVNKYGPNLKG